MQAQLVPLQGGHPIVLDKAVMLIGRKAPCDVELLVQGISKQHCRLVQQDGKLVVEDLDSRNGTWVNGERIQRHELQPDDELALAKVKFRVQFGALDPSVSETPAAGHLVHGTEHEPPVGGGDEWYVMAFGQKWGPMPFHDLRQMADSGELRPSDKAKSGVAGEWMLAGLIDRLFEADQKETSRLSADERSSFVDDPPTPSHPLRPPSSTSAAADSLSPTRHSEDWEPSQPRTPDLLRTAESHDAATPAVHAATHSNHNGPAEVSERAPRRLPKAAIQAAARHARNEKYSFWDNGLEHGPVSYDSLLAKAEHNELKPSDYVKLERTDRWVPACRVAGLFLDYVPEFPMEESNPLAGSSGQSAKSEFGSVFSAESEAHTSTAEAATRILRHGTDQDSNEQPADWSPDQHQGSLAATAAPIKPQALWGQKKLSPLGKLIQRTGQMAEKVAPWKWGVAAAVVVAVLAYWLITFSDRGVYQTYTAIWNELKDKRHNKDTPRLEWEDFVRRAKSELEPILADLEKTAGASDRPRQRLLWAGRDFLVKMLDNSECRTRVTKDERRFAQLLREYEELKGFVDPSKPAEDFATSDDTEGSDPGDPEKAF